MSPHLCPNCTCKPCSEVLKDPTDDPCVLLDGHVGVCSNGVGSTWFSQRVINTLVAEALSHA